jgi:hypothetical protein
MMIAVPSDVTSRFFLAGITALLLAGSCGGIEERKGGGVDPCADLACRPTTTANWTTTLGRKPMDLLIVVDDRVPSGPAAVTFAKEMQDLAETWQELLNQEGPYLADLHIAMATSNLSPGIASTNLWPAFQACPKPAGAFVQTSLLCEAPTNFLGSLAELLTCAGTSLTASGQPSRPLETVHALLSPGGPAETTGFRRPDGLLFLAIITSEDEPALGDAATRAAYYEFLAGLVSDPSYDLEIALVAPESADGLRELAQLFDDAAFFEDIVADSWHLSWLEGPREWHGSVNCIGQADLDDWETTDEPRPTCYVSRRSTKPDGSTSEIFVPQCLPDETQDQVCWRAMWDHMKCPSGREVSLEIVNPPQVCRTSDRVSYEASCATAYQPAHPLGSEVSP